MTWHIQTPEGKPWTTWEPNSVIHTRPLYFDTQDEARECWREHPVPAALVHDSGLREAVS
jgi:hypothetical protein